MEIARQKIRKQMLRRFTHIRKCVLARELFLLTRSNRVALDHKDADGCCTVASKLCREASCTESSEVCKKAAEAALTSEIEHLKLCINARARMRRIKDADQKTESKPGKNPLRGLTIRREREQIFMF